MGHVTALHRFAESPTLICVDRREPQVANVDYVTRFVESNQLQTIGSCVYDLTQLESWEYEPQSYGSGIEAGAALERLRCSGKYQRALDLRDAAEIIQRGVQLFEQCFGTGSRLILWRGQAYDRNFARMFPYVHVHGRELVKTWRLLSEKIDSSFITRLRP